MDTCIKILKDTPPREGLENWLSSLEGDPSILPASQCSLLDHCRCEYFHEWIKEKQLEEFVSNNKLVNAFISRLLFVSINIGSMSTQIPFQGENASRISSDCLGCNSVYENNGENGSGCRNCGSQSSIPSVKLSDIFHSSSNAHQTLPIILHEGICLLSFTISLLTMKSTNPVIVRGIEYVIDMIIGTPNTNTDHLLDNFESQIPLNIPVLATFVGLIDNCYRLYPRCAHLAVTLLSICVTKRPSEALAQIDPDPLLSSIYRYIGDMWPRVSNARCIVEEYYGITEVLNLIPLLFFLGDWGDSKKYLAKHRIAIILASLATNIAHSAAAENHSDCPKDLIKFPELYSARVLVEELYADKVDAMRSNPFTFATCALVEILARWEAHCGISISDLTIPCGDDERISVKDSFLEYSSKYEKIINRNEAFTCILPLVHAFASGEKIKTAKVGLLRTSILHTSMKCNLRGCQVYGNLMTCSGKCNGLARYCSKEHQKIDWKEHKKFCLRNVT